MFQTEHHINTGLVEIEEVHPEQRRASSRICVLNHKKKDKPAVNINLSKQRGSLFLQSGASVSVPVNLSEPVVAVAVGAREEDAPAEASEGEDEEDEEEEEQVEEKPKPICMDGKTYVRCFKEAVKEALGDRFEEEVTKMHE